MESTVAGVDSGRFAQWWRHALPEHPPIDHISMLTGGRSNLSYLIEAGGDRWVLRRPPLGHRMETAHDMGREARVQAALAGSPVPVPRILVLGQARDADTGIDTDFYIMEFIPGRTLSTRRDNAALAPGEARAISNSLARVLADLHSVDPMECGLGDLGRPDGFLERQVRRWRAQRAASTSREIPGFDTLESLLVDPPASHPAIVHGDYKLNNVLIAPDSPNVVAVLDWEMATLGDRFADLALLGVYWELPSYSAVSREVFESAVDPAAGYPALDDLLHTYALHGGEVPHLSWHLAFAAYKLAVINESLHYRYATGATVGEGFERIGEVTPDIVALGLDHANAMRSSS